MFIFYWMVGSSLMPQPFGWSKTGVWPNPDLLKFYLTYDLGTPRPQDQHCLGQSAPYVSKVYYPGGSSSGVLGRGILCCGLLGWSPTKGLTCPLCATLSGICLGLTLRSISSSSSLSSLLRLLSGCKSGLNRRGLGTIRTCGCCGRMFGC